MAGSSALTIRIDDKLLNRLKTLVKKDEFNRGLTQASVVESLLEYYFRQNPEVQDLILSGGGGDSLQLHARALQLVTWGDHAAQRSFWRWAIDSYSELDKISSAAEAAVGSAASEKDSLGIVDLRRIAWYKLGTAWINVARNLRKTALSQFAKFVKDEVVGSLEDNQRPTEWVELYDAARESLRVAIANFQLFDDSLRRFKHPSHPTILYNQACSWSLIAEYTSEQYAESTALQQLALNTEASDGKEGIRELENALHLLTVAPVLSEVEDALAKTSEFLSKIEVHYLGNSEGIPLADTLWLFDYAEDDPDLAFYRVSSSFEYCRWLSKRTTKTSLLDSYKRFRREVPRDIETIVRESKKSAPQSSMPN